MPRQQEQLDRLTEGNRWQRSLAVRGYYIMGYLIIIIPLTLLILFISLILE